MPQEEHAARIGKRISELLAQHNMTQTDLAKATDIPQPIMNKLIRGRAKRNNADYLNAIAVKLGVTLDYLLTGRGGTSQEVGPATQSLGDRMTLEEFLRGPDGDDITQRERRLLEKLRARGGDAIARIATAEEWSEIVRVVREEFPTSLGGGGANGGAPAGKK
jgi:transcriptional regulator with XRE-family HTH domain